MEVKRQRLIKRHINGKDEVGKKVIFPPLYRPLLTILFMKW
jgi:hypothetical protein